MCLSDPRDRELGKTRKAKEPCDHWWGNLCGGFGGTTECKGCGWEDYEHTVEAAPFEEPGWA